MGQGRGFLHGTLRCILTIIPTATLRYSAASDRRPTKPHRSALVGLRKPGFRHV